MVIVKETAFLVLKGLLNFWSPDSLHNVSLACVIAKEEWEPPATYEVSPRQVVPQGPRVPEHPSRPDLSLFISHFSIARISPTFPAPDSISSNIFFSFFL